VGYIPAENIETPFERLARLNKHRNVELAAATAQEKSVADRNEREKLKGLIAGKSKSIAMDRSGEGSSGDSSGPRRVIFAPPTYVDHPGKTWVSDGESDSDGDESGEDEMDDQEDETDDRQAEQSNAANGNMAGQSVGPDMEPDDGVEWADQATIEQQRRMVANRQPKADAAGAAQSNNPYLVARQNSSSDSNGPSSPYDPAHASNDVKRITVTPNVAQGANGSPLLPSAVMQQQQNGPGSRNVSGQSVNSLHSVTSNSSLRSSSEPGSPPKKIKKSSKEDLAEGGEKKKKGVLSGLFSRKGKDKDKKGISSSDKRNSEDSQISVVEGSPASQSRYSLDESPKRPMVTINERQENQQAQPAAAVQHSYRLQQRDQALQQSYSSKYLKSSPSSDSTSPIAEQAAAAVAQSAAAMRLSAMNGGSTNRPPSLMISPNPAGPPLLNVMRVFAGDHIRSEASFKTVLLNETTTSSDLIRQAMQRFSLKGAAEPSADTMYYLTIKDMSGEEMELTSPERPLPAFQEVVARWSEDDDTHVKKVKRSSISSISSMMSLSNHPAIAKLGMNDYGDDSAVKIYLNRRRPGSMQVGNGMPEPSSEFSSYNTPLSTVKELSPNKALALQDESGTSTPPRRNPGLTVNVGSSQASPERFSSPSAKFTIQLLIHQSDLPDGSAFDPASDSIISRQVVRDRMAAGHPSPPMGPEPRKRLFILPRNATVVEAIEQGLERFGILEGVVDGGDDVESKVGDRRSGSKVRYTLSAVRGGDGQSFFSSAVIMLMTERALFPSSKLLEAYTIPPKMRPVEKSTKEQRRRSRDVSLTLGDAGEVLPTDPVFILRRVNPKTFGSRALNPGTLQSQQRQQPSSLNLPRASDQNPKSPQEIIAAQRAASRATQEALISAQENQSQGVDVVVRDKGTIRSSRLLEANGAEVLRYSYIDDEGETYDISELLEEEWGSEAVESPEQLSPPKFTRQGTDQSIYHTAPSTPLEGLDRPILGGGRPSSTASGSYDLLHSVVQRSAGQPDSNLEERLHRVIDKVKSTSSMKSSSSMDSVEAVRPTITSNTSYGSYTSNGRTTPTYNGNGRSTPNGQVSGRTTPQARSLSPLPEGRKADLTPRSTSRQQNFQNTAATVNRIISRHRQQPSIASILSDLSVPAPHDEDEGSSTPRTATSSTHPTPPLLLNGNGGVYRRAVSTSPSPYPRAPISYSDDFGIKALLAIVEARAKDLGMKKVQMKESDEVEKYLVGDKVVMDTVHPAIKGCFADVQSRLDKFDEEVDDLLAQVGRRNRGRKMKE